MDVIGLGICWRTIFDYGDKALESKELCKCGPPDSLKLLLNMLK